MVSPFYAIQEGEVCMKDVLFNEARGKVLTCCIYDTGKQKIADIQLLCVGKPKGNTYFNLGWKHTPQLAPSRDLVTHTKFQQRKNLDWWQFYVDNLLNEWEDNKEFNRTLIEVINYLNDGKDVAIACYCPTQKRKRCHLSILGKVLEDLGYEVEEYRKEV